MGWLEEARLARKGNQRQASRSARAHPPTALASPAIGTSTGFAKKNDTFGTPTVLLVRRYAIPFDCRYEPGVPVPPQSQSPKDGESPGSR